MNWIFSGFELSTRVLDQCRLCADSSSFLLPTFMCNSEQLAQLTVHVSLALSSATQLPAVHLVKEKEICSSARRVSCSNANSYRPQGSEWIPVSGSVFASWYPHLVTGIWLSSVMWQIKYLAFFSLLLLLFFFFTRKHKTYPHFLVIKILLWQQLCGDSWLPSSPHISLQIWELSI